MREFTLIFTLEDNGTIKVGGTYFDEGNLLDDSLAQVTVMGMLEIAKASLIAQRWKMMEAKHE